MHSKNNNQFIEQSDNHEMLDIVDCNDLVIQTLPRSEVYQKNLCHQMRSVWLLIKNDQGQLWIPRRSLNLKSLPGHLDGSVSGHVQAGESYQQALFRETQEEVGIDLAKMAYDFLGKLTPHDHRSFCFAQVYECKLNQEPKNWNRDEMDGWQWLAPEEIMVKLQQGEKMKSNLPLIVQHFYLKKK